MRINKLFNVCKENRTLTILLLVIGVISALNPYLLTSFVMLLFFLYFFVFKTKKFFLFFAIILFLQQSLIKTYYKFGLTMKQSMIISRFDDFIWIAMLLLFIIKLKENKKNFAFTSIDYSAMVLILFSYFSLFINQRSLFWGSVSILLMLKGYLIYFIGEKFDYTSEELKKFINIYLFALIIIAIIGILQSFDIYIPLFPPGYRYGLKVINSIFGTHTAFGTVMAVGATLSLSFLISRKEPIFIFFLVMFLWGIVVSTSRRSLISFLAVLMLLPFITKDVSKKVYIPLIFLFVLIVFLFRDLLSVLFTSTFREYVQSFLATPRGELYTGMVRILSKKPFWGEGPGSFAGLVSKLTLSKIPFKYGLSQQALHYASDAYPAHIFGELGLVGGIIYLLYLTNVFKRVLKVSEAFNNTGDKFLMGMAIYLKSIFIIGIVESFVSSFFEVTIKSFAFFGIFAISVSVYKRMMK